MQYYNSGTMNGCDGNVYAEGTRTLNGSGVHPVARRLASRPSRARLARASKSCGGGVVDPSVVVASLIALPRNELRQFCTQPDLATPFGAMTWSINWDASNGSISLTP